MRKVRITVDGRVQGVGFRYTTKMIADELGITGLARNEWDGSVLIEAVGEQAAIEEFIQKIKESPSPYGRVNEFQIEDDPEIKVRKNFITN
ncbi:MAG TPA: acylphosphatase [Tetragenococcus sp.]|nr:acylphosphatase [Tetragenococcus sp.]